MAISHAMDFDDLEDIKLMELAEVSMQPPPRLFQLHWPELFVRIVGRYLTNLSGKIFAMILLRCLQGVL